jgi:hypothetical protein
VNVKSVTGNKLVWRTFTFTPATTRRIRVVVKSALQANSRIVEIEAYEDGASPTVSFAAAGSSGAESVTPVRLSVSLSAASGRAVTVPYAVSGTSSGGGVDYTLAGGALSFNPGTTSQTISFPVVDDAVFEGSETVVVTLGMPTNATLGAYPAHTYTITDNDPSPTVSFAAAGSSGAESATPVRLSVSLSAASGRTVTVPYAVSGTASGGGVDYTLAGGALSFNPGTTSQTISFPVVDDAVFEGSETVVVSLPGAHLHHHRQRPGKCDSIDGRGDAGGGRQPDGDHQALHGALQRPGRLRRPGRCPIEDRDDHGERDECPLGTL